MAAGLPQGILVFDRLRTDVRLAILVLFCTVAVLGIGPFAVYRFVHGDLLAGGVDTSIVLLLLGAMAYAWRGGNVEHAALVVAATTTLGCLAIGRLLGLPGAFWSYPAVMANFLLIARGRALAASALLVLGLLIDGGAFATPVIRAMYFASAAVTCLLAYVFARRTQMQRAQLERLASRDPLTGAGNRRAMEQELHVAAEAFRRHGVPAGLLVMDLDHFKRVNDEFGHEAGDDVLVAFARVVQARCRAGDRLFRYGGEEFVLLLPGTDVGTLHAFADALRASVPERVRAGGEPITVSIGGAVLAAGEDNAHWLARADAAMYAAKRTGRDRVVVDDAPASIRAADDARAP